MQEYLVSSLEPTISIDFRPMYMENIALNELEVAEPEFEDALNGVTPSVDCMEYTYQVEQSGINWDERISTTRLYWILKEGQLGVKVHDVSQHGQRWENVRYSENIQGSFECNSL